MGSYGSNYPTDSVKALKEVVLRIGFNPTRSTSPCYNPTHASWLGKKEERKKYRMWADAQRDGRPVEYMWRSLRKFRNSIPCRLLPRRKVWLTPTTRVPCSSAANIGERKIWTQSEFCTWQNSLRRKQPPKMYMRIMYQPRGWPNIVQSLVDIP